MPVWSRAGKPMTRLVVLLCLLILCSTDVRAQTSGADVRVRIVTNDFVLPGKLEKLSQLADQAKVQLESVYVETAPGDPKDWLNGADLVILDTPRPMDAAKVRERLGSALAESKVAWIQVGGGPPAFENVSAQNARPLIGYYAAGGEANFKAMLAFIRAWRTGGAPVGITPPSPVASIGFYHPDAPSVFSSIDDYLNWSSKRWSDQASRVGFVIHSGLISGMETKVLDYFVHTSEKAGLAPIVFWFDASDPDGLTKILRPAKADALVIGTHLQNATARAEEFLRLDIPVLQAIGYRDGGPDEWSRAPSGMSAPLTATFLAVPESWGVSDPLVTDAVYKGEPTPIVGQAEALIAKLKRLTVLKHKPATDKRIGLMFWNYPPGEKNFSASNLNVPLSLHELTKALNASGYAVPVTEEGTFIEAGQAMLGGVYQPDQLAGLVDRGFATGLPLARYLAWFNGLPEMQRNWISERWGAPDTHFALRDIAGEKNFVIPRFQIGNMVVMPQLPRAGKPGEAYHDGKQPPDHFYLAAYLYLRESYAADALIHLGTHGTQEWTPGKDRGLSVDDFPYMAVGDLPVFYPYIQDNVAEAVQAKRRGRAVTISHQTPAFAPAGLYDELRDLHAKIHEYAQLDDGAVRESVKSEIIAAVTKANYQRDLGWDDAALNAEFDAFLSQLHDHLHVLAAHVMPLGLHTLGVPSRPEDRLSTVMQQLGQPFYELLDTEPDEFFATDFASLQNSKPYQYLKKYLRDESPTSEITNSELREFAERAIKLDRHLEQTGEIEALLAGLAGRLIAPGSGGDPVRNPDVPSGKNLFAFEADKLPTKAAYEAGGKALEQLVDAYRKEHNGAHPEKLAFSLWSSEAIRHMGVLESQVLHALGLRPVWNEGGRIVRLDIVPPSDMPRPRIDTVLQVTSVYRDQFDSFMRLLSDAIARIAQLDEMDSAIALNSREVATRLMKAGVSEDQARQLAVLRLFSNEPGDYGTGLPDGVLKSTSWETDAPLAEAFLDRMQYAYGGDHWGLHLKQTNLLAEQLKGVQAAVLSRSSMLHGLLSTDHPFEYLGGISLAVRHLDGRSPSLYISDLREKASKVTPVSQYLSTELRARYLNPHWITGMKREGYAGTLEILNAVNNLWGWQVTDPATVRDDQWQSIHETFVNDIRNLELDKWFEANNPTAQAQIIERLVEAIRKGYWDAQEETRKQLLERAKELAELGAVISAAQTREFMAATAVGFGLSASKAWSDASEADVSTANSQSVRGQVWQAVSEPITDARWDVLIIAALLSSLIAFGAVSQARRNTA